MYVKKGFKGVSTALATIAIISVLILGMSWMAYTVLLNAQQQAAAAGRGETVALKAKELVRVYIWLDPARQPDNRYLNLTRISFVNEWSGETVINSLLVVYNNAPAEVRQVSIRLGAGERKTYLPSELGLSGLDSYNAFLARVKYIQAHTSLGNDFVSLWGEPGKPALYVTGTTRTDTYTITTTTTTQTPTTTTTSRTTTSYTVTVTTTTTTYSSNPYMWGKCEYTNNDGFIGPPYWVSLSFSPGTWGTPPYKIIVKFTWTNYWGTVGATDTITYDTNGAWSGRFNGLSGYPPDYYRLSVTFAVVDSAGNGAWIGVGCPYYEPPSRGTPTYTTSTGPPVTSAPDIVVVHTTVTSTTTTYVYENPVATVTSTLTYWATRFTTVTTWVGLTSTHWVTVTVTQTHIIPYVKTIDVTQSMYAEQYAAIDAGPGLSCPLPELAIVAPAKPGGVGWRAVAESLAAAAAASVVWRLRGRRRLEAATLAVAAAALLWAAQPPATGQYRAELGPLTHSTTTITYVTWVTVTRTVTGGTATAYTYVTSSTTFTATETFHYVATTVTQTEVRTTGTTVWTAISTVTITVHPCRCLAPVMCIWECG